MTPLAAMPDPAQPELTCAFAGASGALRQAKFFVYRETDRQMLEEGCRPRLHLEDATRAPRDFILPFVDALPELAAGMLHARRPGRLHAELGQPVPAKRPLCGRRGRAATGRRCSPGPGRAGPPRGSRR